MSAGTRFVIQVQGLCKRFLDYQRGWVTAIADISFECQPGAIFGLLGPNGAGKTTTLRILSTVLKPTGGRAIVAGHDVLTEPQAVRAKHRLHVGQHRDLRPDDRLGAGRVLRPALRHARASGCASGWKRSSTGSR